MDKPGDARRNGSGGAVAHTMTPTKSIFRRFDEYSIPLVALLRIFLGGYFIKTGMAKIADPVVFLKAVRLYEVFPESPSIYMNGTAVVLPWLEVLCGAALVLGIFRRGSALLLVGMLSVFTPAIFLRAWGVMAEDGIRFFQVAFDCGCGTGPEIIWIKLSKNIGLFSLAMLTLFSRCSRFGLAGLFDRRRNVDALCKQCGVAQAVEQSDTCSNCAPAVPTAEPAT